MKDNYDFKARVRGKYEINAYCHDLGVKMLKIEKGETWFELELEPRHLQQDNYAHGGVILALCDIAAGFAAYSVTPPPERVVTAEIKVSYLRPGQGDRLSVRGFVLKPGRNMHFCESEVWAYKGGIKRMVAKATTIMAVIRSKS